MASLAPIKEADLDELLPLLRGYCEFYETDPPDDALLELSRWLLEHPEDGIQVLARSEDGAATGFATTYWTWRTMYASRIAVLEDLFVAPEARGTGGSQQACLGVRFGAHRHGVPSNGSCPESATRVQASHHALDDESTAFTTFLRRRLHRWRSWWVVPGPAGSSREPAACGSRT